MLIFPAENHICMSAARRKSAPCLRLPSGGSMCTKVPNHGSEETGFGTQVGPKGPTATSSDAPILQRQAEHAGPCADFPAKKNSRNAVKVRECIGTRKLK